MNIVRAGMISTSLVVSVSILSFVFIFFETPESRPVLLSFDIIDNKNMPDWCYDLSQTLEKNNVKAVVFITGRVAEQYPQCVQAFANDIDIGSQTYNYVELDKISDYTVQLREVEKGKNAVDKAGNLDSKLFKAPNGNTDDNIYSILNRAGILADFSYDKQYNQFSEDHYVKYNLTSYDGAYHNVGFFKNLQFSTIPLMINFDNTTPVTEIDDFISNMKSDKVRFVSASELTHLDLTIRMLGDVKF